MSFLLDRIRQLGGAATTAELYAAGAHREMLRAAVRAGHLRRARQGWYIDPDTAGPVADAVRLGGRATCVTAVQAHGLWVREETRSVHAAVAPNACQLRDPGDYRHRLGDADAVVHWVDDRSGSSRLTVPVPQALLAYARCFGVEAAFVAAECALHRGLMSPSEWRAALSCAPADLVVALADAGSLSASGLESLFVFRGRRLGLRIRQQVQIGSDRVDAIVGDRLVVELDGREFHDAERDYARDARLSARGFRVIRFSYRQVMFEWSSVEASLLAAVARGDQL